jgi:phytoene synthase
VFAVCGVNESEVLAGQMSEGLAVALTRIAEMAREHLAQAKAAIDGLPRSLRPAFAPAAIIGAQLRRVPIEAPFQSQPDLADWRKIALLAGWRLWHRAAPVRSRSAKG